MPEIQNRLETPSIVEPLSEERLGDLLASVGNHEGKALLLVAMANGPEGKTYGRTALHELVRELPGATTAYLGNEGNQLDWCGASLAPIGMVAKSDYSKTMQYGVTPEGKVLGKALAGFMLEFGEKHGIPLLDLLGTTHTRGGVRSPETRLKMIRGLVQNDEPLSDRQLVEIVGFSTTKSMTHQLTALDTRGLLEYDFKDRNSDVPSFFLKEKDYRPKAGKVFTPLIIEALKLHEQATLDEVFEYAKQATPPESIGIDEKIFRNRIHVGIYALKRRGIISALNLRELGTHGKVSLTETQRAFWTEFVEGVDQLQAQNIAAITQYKELADKFIANPGKVQRALERAAEASILAQNGTEKRTDILVEKVLEKTVGFISVKDVVRVITEKHGRTISEQSVRVALKTLQEHGRVKSQPGTQKPVYSYIRNTTSIS